MTSIALARCTRPVDGTIPIQALLYDDEQLLASQDGVGIYDGTQKSTHHQLGSIHVSTHRLFYISAQRPASYSFTLNLTNVTQTEYYAGLFKSSPKVTLHLSYTSVDEVDMRNTDQTETWECQVCAFKNPPGLSPAAARICGLCGVPRDSVPSPSPTITSSSSLPNPSSPPHGLADRTDKNSSNDGNACPACTFINHRSLRTCEICGTALPQPRSASGFGFGFGMAKSAPSTRPASPDTDDDDDDPDRKRMIKVSFRKGGDRALYTVLKRSLKTKAWEANAITTKSNPAENPQPSQFRSGITGILHTVESTAQGQDTHIKDALQDLEALMVKAKDMVRLAAELNEKLTASTAASASTNSNNPYAGTISSPSLGSTVSTLIDSPSSTSGSTLIEPESATFIRSSLAQLGLQNAPVTLDMVRDERKWFEELARELGGILQGTSMGVRHGEEGGGGGLMRNRGVIALDEVWGAWNRARGVALIPPQTLLQILPLLPRHTSPPVQSRTFPVSGLQVLHTSEYSSAVFAAHLVGTLGLLGSMTDPEIRGERGISLALVRELVEEVERHGGVCRDDGCGAVGLSGGGGVLEGVGAVGWGWETRWWLNVFEGYVWDGHVFGD